MWTGGLRCAATTGYCLATLQVAEMGADRAKVGSPSPLIPLPPVIRIELCALLVNFSE